MQEKVSGSHFVCLARVSSTAASTGLHTARSRSRRPDFPWPCCPDAFMPAHHGNLPSTPIHTRRCKSHQLYQASHTWLLCDSHQEASPTQELLCTSEILAGHSCTVLPLLYQLHFSGQLVAWILFCPCDLLHGLKTVFLW